MKNILVLFLIISFGIAKELELGSGMPEANYMLDDISGKKLSLADIQGKYGTLIIFSCNTCPFVIQWEDRYVKIAEEYIPKGIGVIAVNSNVGRFDGDDSIEEMVKHAKKNDYNFPYAQDQKSILARAFGATKTPHIYLFDDSNILVYRGAIDDNARNANKVDEPYLANAIDQLLDGKPIKKPISKAIGCSIKF
tara:strand:+ start:16486 stop:17067 length:582 start_codon:yes stop_codon:yes gene_type:complete